MAGRPDMTTSLIELQKKRREEEDLEAKYEVRKQVLESLEQCIDKLRSDYKNAQKVHLSFEKFHKHEDAFQAVEKAERGMQQGLRIEEELQRLRNEYTELQKRKQELELQLQRHRVYRDCMERVLKMTMFEDVESLSRQLENLLHFRDKLYKKGSEAQEKAYQQRERLVTLKDQNHLMQLQKNNKLSQLKTELEETRSKTLIWERSWNDIHDIAATKTLLLGQIKIATINLYEMAGGNLEEEECVNINDTEKQLDRIKMFIKDQEDIIKRHQALSAQLQAGKRKVQKHTSNLHYKQ
ncbi:coiled-coil domain-containing protein 42 [Channa argus]|uniref:coiled-coil domain-containing protein 42 n=1 Tax=Channa argus TaxID=215402 RepID=UPI00294804DD|nr:hypothetical protein Q8A73_011908 [Channa argus]